MMVSNRNLLFQGSIFWFHVCFWGCNFNYSMIPVPAISSPATHGPTMGGTSTQESLILGQNPKTSMRKKTEQISGSAVWTIDMNQHQLQEIKVIWMIAGDHSTFCIWFLLKHAMKVKTSNVFVRPKISCIDKLTMILVPGTLQHQHLIKARTLQHQTLRRVWSKES